MRWTWLLTLAALAGGCQPSPPDPDPVAGVISVHVEPAIFDAGTVAAGSCNDVFVTFVNDSDVAVKVNPAAVMSPAGAFVPNPSRHPELDLVNGHSTASIRFVFDPPPGPASYVQTATVAVYTADNGPLDGVSFTLIGATDLSGTCGTTVCSDTTCAKAAGCWCYSYWPRGGRQYYPQRCLADPTPGVACDDGNPCTASDACTADAGLCAGQATPGVLCDDGNLCTESDQCQPDGGCGGAPRTCTAPPTACADPGHQWIYQYPGTCIAPGGVCSYNQVGVIACGNGCDADAGVCR